MSENQDLFELIDAIDEINDEGARIPLVEEAIRLADQLNERYYSFDLRMDLVRYAVFNGQALKALPAFAWCLAEAEKEDCDFDVDDILWEYKWINNYVTDFHEIPMSKIDELNADFKVRLRENGYNLNSYYYLLINRGISTNDKAFAEEAYNNMKKQPSDGMSDCRACVQDGLVDYALFMGDYALAQELATPILSGKMSCAEVPHYTYGHMLLPAYFAGEYEKAAEIEKKAYKLIYKNQEFLGIIGNFLLYYAFTDPKKLLERYPKFVMWSYDPYTTHIKKWDFASSTSAALAKLVKDGYDKVKLLLHKDHPHYNETGEYHLKDLQDYHYNIAREIGDKLDARNGNTGYMDRLAQKMDRI